MISGLSAQGKYMYIHGGHSSGPYVNMSNPSAGMMRYNGSTNNTEVYDGSAWMTINGSIGTVGLNAVAESAIDWALKRMAEEQEWEELAKTSKAVTIALENLNKVKAELKLIALLAKEQNEETTS
jgi:hypothetical protein